MRPEADWFGWREALEAILTRCDALPEERVEAARALGCAVAEDVTAAIRHPPWDNSAMDGFAVRGSDAQAGARLRLVDESAAGSPAGPTRPSQSTARTSKR